MKQGLVALLIIFCSLNVKAQLSIGPKAGLNLARISFSAKDFSTSVRPGFFGGLFAHYRFSERLSGQTELLYSGEGTNEQQISSGEKGYINKSYFQVPLLLQYSITDNLFVETGPQIGLLLSSKETFDGQEVNIKAYYKKTDLRWPLGVGYKFGADGRLGISARYAFSLSKINKVVVNGNALKNEVFGIGLTLSLYKSDPL